MAYRKRIQVMTWQGRGDLGETGIDYICGFSACDAGDTCKRASGLTGTRCPFDESMLGFWVFIVYSPYFPAVEPLFLLGDFLLHKGGEVALLRSGMRVEVE